MAPLYWIQIYDYSRRMPKVVTQQRPLMKRHRSNRSRSHPGARAELFPARGGEAEAGESRPRSVCRRAPAAMGNQHSASHPAFKPRKNVHWKSAGTPTRLPRWPGPAAAPPRAPISPYPHFYFYKLCALRFLKRGTTKQIVIAPSGFM